MFRRRRAERPSKQKRRSNPEESRPTSVPYSAPAIPEKLKIGIGHTHFPELYIQAASPLFTPFYRLFFLKRRIQLQIPGLDQIFSQREDGGFLKPLRISAGFEPAECD
ncbi:hypothetical protein J2X35_002589 [Mesorhizobium sp. BE184]|nr:hypothetical protein [Mesorhizobium sp. BE184]